MSNKNHLHVQVQKLKLYSFEAENLKRKQVKLCNKKNYDDSLCRIVRKVKSEIFEEQQKGYIKEDKLQCWLPAIPQKIVPHYLVLVIHLK